MDAGGSRRELELIYRAAIEAVEPRRLVAHAMAGKLTPGAAVPSMIAQARRVLVLAAGKAGAGMMRGIEDACGDKITKSILIVPEGIAARDTFPGADRSRATFRCGHPVPNASSERAARAALALAGEAGEGDLMIVAISGGASALMAIPDGAVTLADKIQVIRLLLAAGASIGELNTVRKHLSAIKGGRLLRAAAGARVLGLMLSDVAGNDLSTIGSGPTATDASTFADARDVLFRFQLHELVPQSVRKHLEDGIAGRFADTVKPGATELERVTNLIVGDNGAALAGARAAAQSMGYAVDDWRELQGEAREVGKSLAAYLCAVKRRRTCVLAGGEPVVRVKGGGRGGREQELALSLALELERVGADSKVAVLAAGSDGIDGPTDAAGAFAYADSAARARAAGVDPEVALARNDSYRVFETLGDLFRPGPTGTNVADLAIALIN
jgi:glycerate 2-kinase